jgi:epsilon-lactone hydrolase
VRAEYEALHAQFEPPPEIDVRPANAGGVHSLVIAPRPAPPTTMLYLHGGGYMVGSAFGYRPLVGALALAAETGVLVPEYRLAPEHPFPAALEDALAAYRSMVDQGMRPQDITVAGDSSGAGLALSLLVSLKQEGQPLPGSALLLCPGIDPMFRSLAERAPNEPEVAVLLEHGRAAIGAYLAGHPADDPLVNALEADLSGLPPMLIQAATGDFQVQDAHLLADRARRHGVEARLDLYPVATHVFQVFWSFLPEAADVLREAGRFARPGPAVSASAPSG